MRTICHGIQALVLILATSTLPAFAQNRGSGADVQELTDEVTTLKYGKSSSESLDSTDQKLMDAERALLESLTAKSGPKQEVPRQEVVVKEEKKIIAPENQGVARVEFSKVEIKQPANLPAEDRAMLDQSSAAAQTGAAGQGAKLDNEMNTIRDQNAALRRDLAAAQARTQAVMRELDATRGKLAVAEIEVNRLSSLIDQKTRAKISQITGSTMPALPPDPKPAPDPAKVASLPVAPPPAPSGITAPIAEVRPPNAGNNMRVATVTAQNIELRLGPGKSHSALMMVPRGTRLLVEARQGEWYRVFAPNGERAWIDSASVVFGQSPMNDASASRAKGYDSNLEDEAFKAFNGSSK